MENADGPKGYRDLLVWQKAMLLVTEIYKLTQGFPQEEKFGSVSQLRRAAISVPSNIAEGQARHTTKKFIQFISHAQGSAAELDTQLRLAQELCFCSPQQAGSATSILEEVRKMLNGLRRKLKVRAA